MNGQDTSSRTIRFRFDARKASQAAAFVTRLAGGEISRAKLIKALYFADKRQLLRTGKTITGDEPVSMEHGPVLSSIYNLIKGNPEIPEWHGSLQQNGSWNVILTTDPGTDLLSPKELEILQASFEPLRDMSFQQLRAYCHDRKNCPELEEVAGTSKPIAFETILQMAGKTGDQVNEIKAQLEEDEFLSKIR